MKTHTQPHTHTHTHTHTRTPGPNPIAWFQVSEPHKVPEASILATVASVRDGDLYRAILERAAWRDRVGLPPKLPKGLPGWVRRVTNSQMLIRPCQSFLSYVYCTVAVYVVVVIGAGGETSSHEGSHHIESFTAQCQSSSASWFMYVHARVVPAQLLSCEPSSLTHRRQEEGRRGQNLKMYCVVVCCVVLRCVALRWVALGWVVLCCLVLSCVVLSCVVLPCVVLCCLVLSCLVLSCLALPCLALPWLGLACLVLSCLVLSCLVLSCLVLSCLVLSCLVLSCLVLSCLFFPECVARVPVSFGGLGVRLCPRKVVSMFATVRNRSQPFASDRNRLR